MSIDIRFITKAFGDFIALDNVSITVPTGELVALLGPSGSGKTTLLRIIAGLDAADDGVIVFHGEDATDRSARERGVGFVFQHYALFRHMTVFDNAAFGLTVLPRRIRPAKTVIREKVMELLRLVQIEYLSDRYPSQLSGGQRQRVALARALAVEPKVLLLDEPFGALDAKVRKDLRRWLRRLHDELQITSLFVTHDQEEALEVADSVVVMNQGRVEQVGTPEEVYDNPGNAFVYHFLGNVNLFHGRIHGGCARIGDIEIEAPEYAGVDDAPMVAYVRPHDIEVVRVPRNGSGIEATIRRVFPAGPSVRLELCRRDTGELVEVAVTRERSEDLKLKEGENIFIVPKNFRVFWEDYSI
ncbi:MAG: sulfate/molybdate ABC transporter ATP-binding protein [bacterium]